MAFEAGLYSPALEVDLTWVSSSDTLWAESPSRRTAACALRGGGGGGTWAPAAARLLGETKGAASSSDAAGGTSGSEHASSKSLGPECTPIRPLFMSWHLQPVRQLLLYVVQQIMTINQAHA